MQPLAPIRTALIWVRRRQPIVASWRSRIWGSGDLDLGGTLYLGIRTTHQDENRSAILQPKRAKLGTNGDVRLYPNVRLFAGPDAEIRIGGGTYLNPGTRVFCTERVEIGRDCAIGWDVQILDNDLSRAGWANKPISGPHRGTTYGWVLALPSCRCPYWGARSCRGGSVVTHDFSLPANLPDPRNKAQVLARSGWSG
jgi:hypothetical protein